MSPQSPSTDRAADLALVRALVAAAGLPAGEDEVLAAANGMPALRTSIAGLYAVEMEHEEDLPVVFRA